VDLKTKQSDDIIRMARKAEIPGSWDLNWFDPYLEIFSALVAAAKQEEIESTLLRLHEQAAGRHNYFQHAVQVIRGEA